MWIWDQQYVQTSVEFVLDYSLAITYYDRIKLWLFEAGQVPACAIDVTAEKLLAAYKKRFKNKRVPK